MDGSSIISYHSKIRKLNWQLILRTIFFSGNTGKNVRRDKIREEKQEGRDESLDLQKFIVENNKRILYK